MKILGLIPARGGSKGVPRKNIRLMAGKPLIAWTIESALAVSGLDSVVVSTEDREIAGVAAEYGAEVPFLRPPELSQDDTPGIDPVLHALDSLPGFDAVLLLQPTSPLRTQADIAAILALAERGVCSAISVTVPHAHPSWMYHRHEDGRLTAIAEGAQSTRRQDLVPVFVPNGAMYFSLTAHLRTRHGFVDADTVGYVMPAERSIDIDTPLDWKVAEMLLSEATQVTAPPADQQ